MKKFITTLGIFIMLAPFGVAHALSSEVHIATDGKATVSSAKVIQIAGSTLFARLYWGDAFMRITIKTNSTTKFLRATGEATTFAEVSVGNLLDVTGTLEPQSDTLNIIASSVRNSSVQKEQSTLSGAVTGIDLSLRQFTLSNKERGIVTVKTTSSTQFLKGSRTLDLEHLRVGDSVTKASGDYDIPSKILSAQSVTTYIDLALYKPRLFIGKLAETPASANATSIKINANGAVFTVFLGDKTTIMRNDKSATTLGRFVAGDTIRLYGTRRESDDPAIDAEVIRNTNL